MADNKSGKLNVWSETNNNTSRRNNSVKLKNAGHSARVQCDYERAAHLFHQSAEVAQEQGDINQQCDSLCWEGDCYKLLGQKKKALERLLTAEEIGGGSPPERLYTLRNLFEIARDISLPISRQEELLKKLEPYKNSLQIGGSKSMVLYEESLFLADCGKIDEAINKMLEALAYRVEKTPRYNDKVYYNWIIYLFHKSGKINRSRAFKILVKREKIC